MTSSRYVKIWFLNLWADVYLKEMPLLISWSLTTRWLNASFRDCYNKCIMVMFRIHHELLLYDVTNSINIMLKFYGCISLDLISTMLSFNWSVMSYFLEFAGDEYSWSNLKNGQSQYWLYNPKTMQLIWSKLYYIMFAWVD